MLQKNGKNILAGIISFGLSCVDGKSTFATNGDHYGVYTAVNKYYQWIADMTDYTGCDKGEMLHKFERYFVYKAK